VESRRQRPATSQRVKKKAQAKAESPVAAFSLPNIAQLIEDGDITIGMLRPVGCVATAADEDCNYAMLVRRRGESLFQLLTRLDQAIDKALTLGIFTDEINH
jgi:acetylglutamate kinase